jgi:Na+-driven multidrug efflux pump
MVNLGAAAAVAVLVSQELGAEITSQAEMAEMEQQIQ